MKDTYRTIMRESRGEFRDRGSKFLAYAFPIFQDTDWQEKLESVRKEHPKARHYCFAYRIGLDGQQFRTNDDGEPSGTAGRPILGQIDSFGLTNIFIAVVRYFGGTLLGTSGLIQAYRQASQHALENAEIIEKTLEDIYELRFDYAIMGDVMPAIKKLELEMLAQDFGSEGRIEIAIRKSEAEPVLEKIKALIAKVPLEMAAAMENIEGLIITFLRTRG